MTATQRVKRIALTPPLCREQRRFAVASRTSGLLALCLVAKRSNTAGFKPVIFV
jgi:hypothetical protein